MPPLTWTHTVGGRARVDELFWAFVTIEGQTRWNEDVIGGVWDSGTPEKPGAIRTLKLKRGMWIRQQMELTEPDHVRYTILDSGGGAPLASGVVDVRITATPGTDHVSIRLHMEYSLKRGFGLMKRVIQTALDKSLSSGLRTLFD